MIDYHHRRYVSLFQALDAKLIPAEIMLPHRALADINSAMKPVVAPHHVTLTKQLVLHAEARIPEIAAWPLRFIGHDYLHKASSA